MLRFAISVVLAVVTVNHGQAQTRRPAVDVSADLDAEVAEKIGPTGGSVTLTDSNGTVYKLTVPPRALLSTETISMKPVSAVKGLPGRNKLAAGVVFEPKGLEFLRDATLTITPKTALAKTDVPMMWMIPGGLLFPQ